MSADIGRRHIDPFGDIAVTVLCSVVCFANVSTLRHGGGKTSGN